MLVKSVSPSRQYVVICTNTSMTNHCFRVFTLPDTEENNSQNAGVYYSQQIDLHAYIDGCVAYEDYLDFSPEAASFLERARAPRHAPEYQADSDACYNVAHDLHLLESDHGNPHVDVRVTFHITLNLKRHNPWNDADYAIRYETTYRTRYAYWLALREASKLKA